MDCKIMHRKRDLWCETHKTTSMSLLCDAAEQELRDRIVDLEGLVEELETELVNAHRVTI